MNFTRHQPPAWHVLFLLCMGMLAGCSGGTKQRPTGSSLQSDKTLDRVYALEDLRDSANPADENLALALRYLADEQGYGLEIVGKSKRVSMENVEVKYQQGIYTDDMSRVVKNEQVCDLAFQALVAHQPAAANLAVKQLADDHSLMALVADIEGSNADSGQVEVKANRFRERLVRVVSDCCRKFPNDASPETIGQLTNVVEKQRGNEIRLEAITALATLNHPEATSWLIEMDSQIRNGIPYQTLRGSYDKIIRQAIANRPTAFMRAFDVPESDLARELFHYFKTQLTSIGLADGDVKVLIEYLVAHTHPQTDEMLIAVMQSSQSQETKELAKTELIALKDKARVPQLIDAHKTCVQSGNEFCRQGIEEALRSNGTAEALEYLSTVGSG